MDTKKILTIPDLHGKPSWKFIFDTIYDHIIFVGDFVDSFDMSDTTIFSNLQSIIDIKKLFPEKIILLWGNHEMQYLFNQEYQCSGYRPTMFTSLHFLLNDNRDLFQYAFQYKNYIWTHGGIHCGWWKYRFKGKDNENIADQLNNAFEQKQPKIYKPNIEPLFDCGWDRGGSAKVGGPLWIDRRSLWEKGIHGYHQIVGHNIVPKIMTCKSKKDGSVTFCDCLDEVEDFYIINV